MTSWAEASTIPKRFGQITCQQILHLTIALALNWLA
jgi:hypothetical protein